MKLARKADTKINKIGEGSVAIEYPVLDKRIHGVIIEVEKRYPDTGFSRNDVCTELAYILEGAGKLVGREMSLEFTAGDQLMIEPGEDFYWEGKMKIFMPCAPAWYPGQHKFSE